MQKIRMLRDQLARHGGELTLMRGGQEYDVDDFLLRQLIQIGVVELIEDKAVSAAPENKAVTAEPKRRGRPRAQV